MQSLMSQLRQQLANKTDQLSYRSWSPILELLKESNESPEFSLAFEYVKQHIRDWPFEQRGMIGYEPEHPAWSLIQHLVIQGEWPTEAGRAVELKQVQQLRALTLQMLSGTRGVGQSRVKVELSRKRWSALESLHFRFFHSTDEWFHALVQKAKLPALKHLSLFQTTLPPHDFRKGFQQEGWGLGTALESLDLTESTHLNADSFEALRQQKALESLQSLCLDRTRLLNDEHLFPNFIARPWKELRNLSMFSSQLLASDYELLFHSGAFPALQSLHLGDLPWKSLSSSIARRSWSLPLLEELSLPCMKLTAGDFKSLMGTRDLRQLKRLELKVNGLQQGHLLHLTRSEHLENLEYLGLSSNQLNDESARLLLEAPHLSSLKTLDLRWNKIGERWRTPLKERFQRVKW